MSSSDLFSNEAPPVAPGQQPDRHQLAQGSGSIHATEAAHGRLRSAAELEQQKARELLENAGLASVAAGEQMRGEALRQSLGGLGSGHAMQSRAAIYGSGLGSYGAGVEASRMGSADRLRSGAILDATMARDAGYERAMWDDYMARLAAAQMAEQAGDKAQAIEDQAAIQMAQSIAGGAIGAGAAGASAAMGGSTPAGATPKSSGQAAGQSAYDQYQYGGGGGGGGAGGYYWDDPGFKETDKDWFNEYAY